MNAVVKSNIVHKINIMVRACFSVKNIFLAFVFSVTTLFLCVNVLISFGWRNLKISDITAQPLHSKKTSKNPPDNDGQLHNVYTTVSELTQCYDRPLKPFVQQRGDFWVLYNYVRAEKRHRCYESITYTTPADYTFLDNIIPLVQHWNGPVSVALHAPGDDFQLTLDAISYLRNCEHSLIKQYVTFHLFFGTQHIPKTASLKSLGKIYEDTYNCSKGPPYMNKDYKDLYKTKVNLTYPINVARNIARITAQTHFIFASDIELYPTPNLITKFLNFVARRRDLFEDKLPKIFVLPVFEILANENVPENKTILQKMVKATKAFYFHKNICMLCHGIPNATEWLKRPENDDLNVFVNVKRQGRYSKWEAFYIGTQEDPLFDERLTWEGQSNKMTQGYVLCLLDYDYMVLDNAFLTHKPGVKLQRIQKHKYNSNIVSTKLMIKNFLKKEYKTMYGTNNKCKLE